MNLTDIVLDNKYTKWYFSICNNASLRANSRSKAKNMLGAVEGHHVLPKSICTNSELVYVTCKEHFVLHHLLTKMLTGQNKHKMIEALAHFIQGRNLSTAQIAICMLHKHRPCTTTRRTNISLSRKNTIKLSCPHCNKLVDPGNFKQYHGDNCKYNPIVDQQVLIKRINKCKNSTLKAIQLGHHKHTSPLKFDPIQCPYCSKVGHNIASMKRFHFNNCAALTGKKHNTLPLKIFTCDKCNKHIDAANWSRHRC